MVCSTYIPTELPFCIPPLLVGFLQSRSPGGRGGERGKERIHLTLTHPSFRLNWNREEKRKLLERLQRGERERRGSAVTTSLWAGGKKEKKKTISRKGKREEERLMMSLDARWTFVSLSLLSLSLSLSLRPLLLLSRQKCSNPTNNGPLINFNFLLSSDAEILFW